MRKLTILLVGIALSACGQDATERESEAQGATEQVAEPTSQADSLAVRTPVGLLGVDTLQQAGAFLTDAGGRALYALEGEDDPDACVDACARAWPPYTRTAAEDLAPTLENVGLDPEMLGAVERPDGTSQVTYGGHPLYFYARETEPGQTTGHDVTDEWGEWYLVQPSGELLHD